VLRFSDFSSRNSNKIPQCLSRTDAEHLGKPGAELVAMDGKVLWKTLRRHPSARKLAAQNRSFAQADGLDRG
jgi:hypothetical protein